MRTLRCATRCTASLRYTLMSVYTAHSVHIATDTVSVRVYVL
jgi:hypothetical protein